MTAHPVILFDGACNLCSASVRWVIERDRRGVFRFASLQSDAAKRIVDESNADVIFDDLPDSVVLVDQAGIHTRSTAAIRIAQRLGFPWTLAAALIIVPRPLRDWLYALIARNRVRWFGSRNSCVIGTPENSGRFLDADESGMQREAAVRTGAGRDA